MSEEKQPVYIPVVNGQPIGAFTSEGAAVECVKRLPNNGGHEITRYDSGDLRVSYVNLRFEQDWVPIYRQELDYVPGEFRLMA